MQPIRISALTTFHNREQDAEHLLTQLYELLRADDELIIIDDASTDETAQIIASVVENSGHENTYFLQNEQQRGPGVCLQQAWEQAGGKLLWLVDHSPEIDSDLLEGASNILLQSDAISVVMGSFIIPKDIPGWLRLLDDGSLPSDSNFLWNINQIPSLQRFISPFWDDYHATDLALRLFNKGQFVATESRSGIQRLPTGAKVRTAFLLRLLSLSNLSKNNRELLIEKLRETPVIDEQKVPGIDAVDLLKKAQDLQNDGNSAAALEVLDTILLSYPDHEVAKSMKVQTLNKMRRYVEAAELKHKLKNDKPQAEEPVLEEIPGLEIPNHPKKEESRKPEPRISDPEISLSVIIPAAGLAQERTIDCLTSLFAHENHQNMEIILLDNACMDDTVNEVQKSFGDSVTIISNGYNPGFAASVNLAVEQAGSDFIAILHNDTKLETETLGILRNLLESNPDYGLLAPMSEATLNATQLWQNREQLEGDIVPVEYADSFCMVFRKNTSVRFDDKYELAFFEDMDYAYQLREAGFKTGLVPSLKIHHDFGSTMRELGMNLLEKEHWKNLAYFNKKWQLEPSLNDEFLTMPELKQLLVIGQSINVLYPEQHLHDYVTEMLTSEVKTLILNEKLDYPQLNAMIRLMMAIDQRDILRRLEEQLDGDEIDRELTQFLITYYFDRNIYSRCKKYISDFKGELPFSFRIFEAKIALNEKEFDKAAELIAQLGKERPVHPELHYLAGELSATDGNEAEAKEYFTSAAQIHPQKFGTEINK